MNELILSGECSSLLPITLHLHLCQTLYLGSIKNIAKSYYSVHFGKWKSKVLKYVMWNLNYAAIRKSHWVGLSRKLAWVGLMMHYLTKNTLENWAWHCPVITLSSIEAAIGLRVVPSWCLVRFGILFVKHWDVLFLWVSVGSYCPCLFHSKYARCRVLFIYIF